MQTAARISRFPFGVCVHYENDGAAPLHPLNHLIGDGKDCAKHRHSRSPKIYGLRVETSVHIYGTIRE